MQKKNIRNRRNHKSEIDWVWFIIAVVPILVFTIPGVIKMVRVANVSKEVSQTAEAPEETYRMIEHSTNITLMPEPMPEHSEETAPRTVEETTSESVEIKPAEVPELDQMQKSKQDIVRNTPSVEENNPVKTPEPVESPKPQEAEVKATEQPEPVQVEKQVVEEQLPTFEGYALQYTATYNVDCDTRLNAYNGEVFFNNHRETYYSEKVLPGGGLKIPGRHVADDGTIRDQDGYICVAADPDYLGKGSTVLTTLGPAKVYDCGCAYGTIDIYVSW